MGQKLAVQALAPRQLSLWYLQAQQLCPYVS